MKSAVLFVVLVACIALVHSGCIPNKYPESRDHCYRDTYDEYPLKRVDYVRYYQHNYVYPERHDGHPYFGYPYGDCSSCRSYKTEKVEVVQPDCGCQKPVEVVY